MQNHSKKKVDNSINPNSDEIKQSGALDINTEESFVLIDSKFIIVTFNHLFQNYYQEHFGVDVKKGDSLLEYLRTNDVEAIIKIYNRALKGEIIARQFDFESSTKNSTLHFSITYKPSFDDEGKIIGVFISTKNITETKKAETILINNEKRFRALVENAADIISLNNRRGKLIYANPALERILGYSVEYFQNNSALNIIHPDYIEKSKLNFEYILKNPGVEIQQQSCFIHKNGQLVWVEGTLINLLDDPNVQAIIANYKDVTATKNAELQIKNSESNLRAIFENTVEGFVLTDREGIIKSFNTKAREIIILNTIDKEIEIGRPIYDYFEESRITYVKEQITKILQGEIVQYDKSYVRADGKTYWLIFTLSPVREDNIITGVCITATDITSRKVAEEQKEFARLSNEALINSTEDLIWSVSNDLKLIAGNTVFINTIKGITGATLKSGDDLMLEEYFTKDFLTFWEGLYKRGLAGESFKHEIYTPQLKDTPQEWSETSINPIYDKEEIIGIACYGRNITYKKLSDEKIRIAKERYDIVAKATKDAIWDWDILNNTMHLGEGFRTLFGYGSDQETYDINSWIHFIHEDDRANMAESIREIIKSDSKSQWETQYRFLKADNSFASILNKAFLIRDENKKAIRMIGAIQDITQQENEKQLLKLLESVITNATDVVMITEAFPLEEPGPKIIYVNAAFSKMTGYTKDEVIGRSPRLLQGKNTDKAQLISLRRSMEENKPCEIEVINYNKKNEEYWVQIAVAPVENVAGTISHFISIQRDITERKKQEQEREQLIRELTQNNKDMRQFSYITSHNLRAPLSNLLGILNLVEDIPIEDNLLAELLEGFKTSTNLLNDTINDLIKVVIIKDNPSVLQEKIKFQEIFENILIQTRNISDKIALNLYYDFTDTPVIHFNKPYLESIFLNLYTNAVKYRSPERPLQISITTETSGNNVVLYFEDNGLGIDIERYHDRLFGLYQKFHNHVDSKGMGLYLVKSQLESLGGTIIIESNVDQGTKFIITFKKNHYGK